MKTSRRSALQIGVSSVIGWGLTAFAESASAANTVSLSSYGSPNAVDNAGALEQAVAAAGPGGTVTVSAGTWKIARTVSLPAVNIVGIDPVTTRFCFTGGAYGLNANPGQAKGLVLRKMGFYGSGGATSSCLHVGDDVLIDACDFYEPAMYSVDVYSGTLTVRASRFVGQARSAGTGIQVNGANSNLDVSGTLFSGLMQGHVADGAGDIKATNNTYLGLWFYSNMAVCQAKVASATPTSVTTTSALGKNDFQPYATATAWKTMASSSTVAPVSGKTGWFTLSGVTPEPRMMVRNGSMFGVVLDVSGPQARIPYWHTTSCYPTPTPSTAMSGMTVERPYIGRVLAVSGAVVTVKAWHAGPKGTYEVPPAGARLQLNDKTAYQCFATNGTKSFTVDSCTVVASWGDQISSIKGQNVRVTNNTLYDGQDVSITLEQITNGCVATGNTSYRSGTAAIYIGSGSAQVSANKSFGANLMTDASPDYSAYTIQGANWANVWSNSATYGGAPFEVSAISIDGVDGQDNSSDAARTQPPFATDLYINSNAYSGYPQYDVTIWGTKAFCEKGHTTWAPGTRFNLLQGANRDMLAL